MNKVFHRNKSYYGHTTTIILADGYASVMVSILYSLKERATIHDLIVHEDKRGQGLGNACLEEAIKEAAFLGAEQVMLSTEPDSWLQEWYERHGFKTVNVTDLDLMGYHRNAIMVKDLTDVDLRETDNEE